MFAVSAVIQTVLSKAWPSPDDQTIAGRFGPRPLRRRLAKRVPYYTGGVFTSGCPFMCPFKERMASTKPDDRGVSPSVALARAN